jgi:hypothetical protein
MVKNNVTSILTKIDTNASYIVGSSTWLDKYKEYKMLAAQLFQQLIDAKFEFPPEELKVYMARYKDVIDNTDTKERIGAYINQQYFERIASGDKSAMDEYITTMCEAGYVSSDEANGVRKMLLSAVAGVGENFEDKSKDEKAVEKELEDAERIRGEEVGVYVKEDADKGVTMTTDEFIKIWNILMPSSYDNEKSIRRFGEYAYEACLIAGVEVEDAIKSSITNDKTPLAELRKVIDNLIAGMNYSVNRSLIDSADITLSAGYYYDWTHPVDVVGGNTGTIPITIQDVNDKRLEISKISNSIIRVEAVKKLYALIGTFVDKYGVGLNTRDAITAYKDAENSEKENAAKEVYNTFKADIEKMVDMSDKPMFRNLTIDVKPEDWNAVCE